MLSKLFPSPRASQKRLALVTAGESWTWGVFDDLTQDLVQRLRPLAAQRVGLQLHPEAACFAALAALEHHRCDVFLLDHQWTPDRCEETARQLNIAALVNPVVSENVTHVHVTHLTDQRPNSDRGAVIVLTSGTTGGPKAARHTWTSLSRPVRRTPAQVCLLTYRPHLYAGLQVILQCLLNYGTLVMAGNAEPNSAARLLHEHNVELVSATPSYWRRLLMFADPALLSRARLKQITLGGEPVDQGILKALHERFPSARIAHIYATTELGRCFSVTDGLAGFPRHWLDAPSRDGVEMSVVEGELWVRSANAMEAYDASSSTGDRCEACENWFKTGDLVQVLDDRVHFVGRRSELINVGGNKVSPIAVESVIKSLPGIADAKVYGKASSIAGQLVACQIVLEVGWNPEQARAELKDLCLHNLAPYQRPRSIEFVNQIEISANGKVQRRATG